ncbi:ubx domain containing protein, putative [Entamoeba invadens IP1]|uniref:Ubx domain containing protein, putative n=1 Tax=Entamoeba invadens IP1 TaxID=370355 RepID=A0A0A1U8H9_ENTIV|nr:ubx domain containing protein, putative [Entamoeba invadens IP1]ELP88288.1 ubx domain containing protein, putative [Entamoeba invadens IP1]|eukprot:XP_004255059.1 ubx domain containing protein, putative [Entamoeba invadens IP1]
MSVHGLSDFGHDDDDEPKGTGFYNKGGTEFYANNDGVEAYKKATETALDGNGHTKKNANKNDFVITVVLYKNGISVNNGGLQSYADSKEFLHDITEGYVPERFSEEGKKYNVTTKIVDSTKVACSDKTAVKMTTCGSSFVGEGKTLGKEVGQNFTAIPRQLNADLSKPTANIKVRFVDGKSKVLKVNLDWSLQNVYSLIAHESGLTTFHLRAQNRVIEMSATLVSDAKIAGTSLMQHK